MKNSLIMFPNLGPTFSKAKMERVKTNMLNIQKIVYNFRNQDQKTHMMSMMARLDPLVLVRRSSQKEISWTQMLSISTSTLTSKRKVNLNSKSRKAHWHFVRYITKKSQRIKERNYLAKKLQISSSKDLQVTIPTPLIFQQPLNPVNHLASNLIA